MLRRRTPSAADNNNNASTSHSKAKETTLQRYERRLLKQAEKTMHTIKGSIPSKGQLQQHTKQTVREISVRKVNYALGMIIVYRVFNTASVLSV